MGWLRNRGGGRHVVGLEHQVFRLGVCFLSGFQRFLDGLRLGNQRARTYLHTGDFYDYELSRNRAMAGNR